MILETVKTYFTEKCPAFLGKTVGVNYLSESVGAVSLSSVSTSPVVRRYTDGGTREKCVILLSYRTYFGEDGEGEKKAAAFFEDFSNWLTNNRHASFLSDGKTFVGFSPLSARTLLKSDAKSAIYGIEFELQYEKRSVNR